MTNKEKFSKELLNIMFETPYHYGFAITKDGQICNCGNIDCGECIFNNDKKLDGTDCCESRQKWAEQMYIERKIFTEEEKQLIRLLDKVKYVARDYSDQLWGYYDRPIKTCATWNTKADGILYIGAASSLPFKAIQWEDEEPTSREEILGGIK